MLSELKKLITEFLGDIPFLVTRHAPMRAGGVRLIFPCTQEKIDEFARILNGGKTPGWRWQAHPVPLVIARGIHEIHGQWAAVEVSRLPLGEPAP